MIPTVRTTDAGSRARHRVPVLALLALCGSAALGAQDRTRTLPVVDEFATMEDKLGQAADLDAVFTDTRAQEMPLRAFVSGERPVLLNLQYFTCPGMCSVGLNALVENLQDSGMAPGREFDLLTVSIDPRETAKLAGDKKTSYLRALGQTGVDEAWKFLVGEETQIRRIADSVGWRFRWSEHTGQYDHPPTIVLLSSGGVTTRYLDYRSLTPATLRRAVIEAGEGKVGSFLERIFVSCLTFDASTGAYSLTAMTIMRIGGVVTLLAIAIMLLVLWRRERANRALVVARTTLPSTR